MIIGTREQKVRGLYCESLQGWMNLIWFILSKPVNRYEKVTNFIDLAISTPKRVEFRDAMCTNADKESAQ